MTLTDLLLGISFTTPFFAAIEQARDQKAGIWGYAFSAFIGVLIGLVFAMLLFNLHKWGARIETKSKWKQTTRLWLISVPILTVDFFLIVCGGASSMAVCYVVLNAFK